ncbi:hypothetical protein BWQ96_00820 [Gracilariopsis chorda]|uniref:PNPLA domain-containing protein n=1 Tax=Gracilariopsis chorda TaxID=448386 RepID=A0A2V3J560_9FLOR|nr:hypothetical protein BWQ96_00820 [Gracilariopsis chorda]|eukprot:PXF49504.1 hypothetical protein BWQ96_00820 [Gracilariopsis chorda]
MDQHCEKKKPPPFRVGLCLAGAATGGAYSAGVIDFLFEALDSWHLEKSRGNSKVPPWDVHLTDVIGSSAGAITASVAAATLNLPSGEQSALRRVWVDEMNADRLLDCSDLTQTCVVSSLLNANFMASTAAMVLRDEPVKGALPCWADNVCLTLRTTNLRGVPYSLCKFKGGQNKQNDGGAMEFHMRQHADYSQFVLTDRPKEVCERVRERVTIVDMNERRTSAKWQQLITCARASSAFPLAFPTVRIEKPKAHYRHRLCRPPDWRDDTGGADQVTLAVQEGDANAQTEDTFAFAANDGGALDNEPFDVLYEFMNDGLPTSQDMGGDKAEAETQIHAPSMILIDPFPESKYDPKIVEDGLPLLKTVTALAHAVRAQAMFKESEIKQAVNKHDMSRFIISPVREVKASQKHKLATASLHAFGGILHEDIRLHDYQLGRVNCKHFLESVFCIPKQDAWHHPTFKHFREYLDGESIPIIPVVGSAAQPLQVPKWPAYSRGEMECIVDEVGQRVERRVGVISEMLWRQFGLVKPAWFWRNPVQWMKNRAVCSFRRRVVKFVERRVRKMLEEAVQVYT